MKKTLLAFCITALLAPATGLAHKAGDFKIRAGVATVIPHERSGDVLKSGNGFALNNDTQMGLTFGYMITDNIGVELLAATPFSHRVSLAPLGNIAKVRHLPPTLVAQYYFGRAESKLRPYLGAGINYTTFFSQKFTNDVDGALTSLSLKDSWGFAAQGGFDYRFDNNVTMGASIWWMDIGTDVKFNAGGEPQKVRLDIDPVVLMFSVGYTF